MRLVPLKRLVDPTRPITYGIVQAGEDVDNGVPYIRPADMDEHNGVPDLRALRTTSEEIANQYRRSAVIEGDLVVSIGPSFGKTMQVPGELAGANLTQGTARVSPGKEVDSRYLRWALRASVARDFWNASVDGATFRALNLEPLALTPIPTWSPLVQRRIADFLDNESARIDALIGAKQRMVELVRDRQAAALERLFSQTGEGVPLKHLLARPLAYGVLIPEFVDDGIPMLRITDLADGSPRMASVRRIPERLSDEYRRTVVTSGDLVVSVVGSMGVAAPIDEQSEGSNLNRALARVSLRDEVPRSLVLWWFRSRRFRVQAQLATGSGSAQPTLNLGDLREFRVPIDPSETTDEYVREVDESERRSRSTISILTTQIELLRERRQALITAAVTGEIQV